MESVLDLNCGDICNNIKIIPLEIVVRAPAPSIPAHPVLRVSGAIASPKGKGVAMRCSTLLLQISPSWHRWKAYLVRHVHRFAESLRFFRKPASNGFGREYDRVDDAVMACEAPIFLARQRVPDPKCVVPCG